MDKIAAKSHLSVQVDVLLSKREITGRQSLKPGYRTSDDR